MKAILSIEQISELRRIKRVKSFIRKTVFANDTALTANSDVALRGLVGCFASAYTEFGLMISLKKIV